MSVTISGVFIPFPRAEIPPFSATNSPSRYEFAVAREFFQELGSPFHVVVAMKAADGGSLLRPGWPLLLGI